MSSPLRFLFPALWLSYAAYWWAMATNVKASERIEPVSSRWARSITILIALALLTYPKFPPPLNGRFLPATPSIFWLGAAITAGGLLFSVWARHHLGKNWSQAVTLKQDHQLITSGPYAYVRHPIYTGLLAALIGSALARGEWRGLVAVALVLFILWRKLRLEEDWLRARFGETYEAYARRVTALVPFLI